MTVCIVALFDNGKGAVLSSDHMITANIPIGYEFENEATSKIHALTDNSYALFAGDVLAGDQIVKAARATIAVKGLQYVEEIAEIVQQAYKTIRLSRITERHLEPRGLTLGSYYERQKLLNSVIVEMVDRALVTENIGVDLIVVGPRKKGYSIYIVANPGEATCVDAIGFTAVGSGAPHVLYSFLGSQYKKSLKARQVKDLVLKAKQISEVAPGVGKQTSIKILSLKEE